MNKNLYLIVVLVLAITTISQTVSFIIGDHQFYQSVQDKCIKCHGDIKAQLSTSDQHTNFSCVNCHARSATNHTNKQPECGYCHATSSMSDTLEAHPDFSPMGSQGCVACHSTYNAILNYSRPEYIDYTIKNNNGNWIISDFKTEGTLNLSYDAMRQGGKHNIKNVSCKDCHKDIFDAVSLGGHAVVLARNGTQVDYHNNSNSTPEEWCRTCHNNNDTKFQNQQHSIKKTTCEQCHQAYNSTHPGNFFSNINTVPHLYRSLVCISCKSAGWPAPGGAISFNVREEPYYDVEFRIIFPLNITDSSPVGDPTTPAGVSQTFSATLNRFADITWYNNGSEIFRVLSVISASYTDSKRIPGVYNITAIASDRYDSTARTWIWNVTNGTGGGGGGGSGGSGGSGGGIGSGTSNNISGYVFDNFGTPLSGVLVQNGSYQNNTSESGFYSITDIPNGEYNFTYSKAGFDSDYFIFSLGGITMENMNKTLFDRTPPGSVTDPNSTTGNFFINNTWINPQDIDFNRTMFRYGNGSTFQSLNNSTNYLNLTFSPHYVQNITARTVDNFGNENETLVWFNATIPDNIPVLSPIGNKTVNEGELLAFNISSVDADNDTMTYGTNAINGTLNATSGQFLWVPGYGDAGVYILDFNSSDGYGGVANETINVTVNDVPFSIIDSLPPVDPVTPSGIAQTFGLTLNRIGDVTWYNNGIEKFTVTGISSANYTNSVASVGIYNITAISNDGYDSISRNWSWNVTAGSMGGVEGGGGSGGSNNSISGFVFDNFGSPLSGVLVQNGSYQNITSPSGYYSITNLSNGTYNFSYSKDGFSTGYFEFSFSGAVIINANKTIYDNTPLDSVSNPNMITGNFYINNTWTNPADVDFNNTNFNYSNGTAAFVANSTTTFWNRTGLSPHEIQNISARTADIYGNINTTNVWFNITIPNNVPDQTIIGNKTVTAGDLLIFNVSATDADNDTITYGTNATYGSLNATTGEYSWPTNSTDAGIYIWYFNSTDNYGGTSTETINVTVTEIPALVPPVPVNLSSTQGNFWINHTWEPGAGNATDSYNVSVNGIWTNGTTSTYNNTTVEPHGWSNITVYAYNSLGPGTLNATPVFQDIQLANNIPVQIGIGDKTITAGDLLTFNISATDADNDTITYGTNATYGTINATTGEYSWLTNGTDTGTYVWYFNSSDNYGSTATETITITVTEIPAYLPPDPVNLNSTRGSSWVNYTWEPGAGNVTDSYNVNVNGTWTNGTTSTYNNTTVGPHGWSNITVYAYNASGSGTPSLNPVSGETQVLNAAPLQAPIGDKAVTAGMELTFSIISTDADSDPLTYGTNATNGTLNTTTGTYSWPTNASDVGTYVWYFETNDTYGGSATETITITVTEIPAYLPPDPVNLNSTRGSSWVNYTWEPGAGNVTDSYNVNVNGTWTNGTSNNYINTSISPHGWSNITVYAYNASGSGTPSLNPVSGETQVLNAAPLQAPIGDKAVTSGSLLTFIVSATDADNDTIIYGTNATNGTINATTGEYSWQTNSSDTGIYTWNFNSSDNYGGVASETITITVTAVLPVNYTPPSPVNLISTQGNFWINHSWEPGAGNVTDSYNVNVNGTWTNDTIINYINTSVDPHGWSNISVYSYNSSGTGTLNTTALTRNTQVSNNLVTIGNISSSYTITAGDTISIYPISSDQDLDTPAFDRNFTNGTFYTNNGTFIWTTASSDTGIHSLQINVTDGYGSVSSANFTVNVTVTEIPTYLPPVPVNLISTQGNFWINYTWEPGAGNVTDSYYVNVNGTWTNGTTSTYNNTTVAAHGWSNISVYSYNASGTGTLNTTPVSSNTQLANNLPDQTTIGNKTVTAGSLLT
ncbi:MAG: cell surface protein, partial [Candidatus Methanoperedens nitroreducens]